MGPSEQRFSNPYPNSTIHVVICHHLFFLHISYKHSPFVTQIRPLQDLSDEVSSQIDKSTEELSAFQTAIQISRDALAPIDLIFRNQNDHNPTEFVRALAVFGEQDDCELFDLILDEFGKLPSCASLSPLASVLSFLKEPANIQILLRPFQMHEEVNSHNQLIFIT